MPKVKLNQPTKMERLIRGYWSTYSEFAEVLDCSPNTAKAKMKNPGRLTLDDLKRIERHGVPKEDIRNSI